MNRLARQKLVARPHLTKSIDAGGDLVLLCAPSGYGKSTLLRVWKQQQTEQGKKVRDLTVADLMSPHQVGDVDAVVVDNLPFAGKSGPVAVLEALVSTNPGLKVVAACRGGRVGDLSEWTVIDEKSLKFDDEEA